VRAIGRPVGGLAKTESSGRVQLDSERTTSRLYKASPRQGDDDLLFGDPHTGGPLSKPAILRRMRKALKAAGLDVSHRFHDLRHTFGTRIAAAGVSMRTLQDWMGTATSRRRSGTRTTRRVRVRPSWSPRRFAREREPSLEAAVDATA
jgi:integrase